MSNFKITDKGLDLIKQFEGFEPKAYLCPAKVLTIGYGTVIDTKEEEWLKTATINESQATDLLRKDCSIFENAVNKMVVSDINQNQFDALVVFTYNVGPGNLRSSTLLKKVNANPKDATIAAEFAKWCRAGGKVLKGLVRRREAEAKLYFS